MAGEAQGPAPREALGAAIGQGVVDHLIGLLIQVLQL